MSNTATKDLGPCQSPRKAAVMSGDFSAAGAGGGTMFSIGQLGNAMAESIAYNGHHFNCPQCQAAGRMTPGQRRCEVGHPLWQAYVQAVAAGADEVGRASARTASAAHADIVPPVGNTGGTNVRGTSNV